MAEVTGYLNYSIKANEVLDYLKTFTQCKSISETMTEGVWSVTYTYKGEERYMEIHVNCKVQGLDGGLFTVIRQSAYGVAQEVIRRVVSYFGGYFSADISLNERLEYIEKTSGGNLAKEYVAELDFRNVLKKYGVPLIYHKFIIDAVKDNPETIKGLF